MGRTVNKSAATGRFVKASTVSRHPTKTMVQTVGGGAHGFRSASTGRFVKEATAQRHPDTTARHGTP